MTTYCALESRRRREPPFGTASRARRWILLEQPGPWGAEAITESALPTPVADRLARWSNDLPARVLLLRRTSGHRHRGGRRAMFAGVSTPRGSWIEAFDLPSVDDALDLDLAGLRDGESVGGQRLEQPLYLVCTNGKHDICCARDGLPVARDLTRMLGDRVWECSHVGGDRFAGNLVCLPDGHFYGHLDVHNARSVIQEHEAGRITLDHWRGRSCHPFPVQAAESLTRAELDLRHHDALEVETFERAGTRYTVHFTRPGGGPLHAVVDVGRGPLVDALTCGGTPAVPPSYELVEVWEDGTTASEAGR